MLKINNLIFIKIKSNDLGVSTLKKYVLVLVY